jgi:hypothetical protein
MYYVYKQKLIINKVNQQKLTLLGNLNIIHTVSLSSKKTRAYYFQINWVYLW